MGKRRERRLAAMMSASRRVKLDLFTEPSGEMVGSSLHDGGDLDKDHHAGVPSSPSSSASRCGGQKQENPLLLLEQYSDDELEEEASEQLMHTAEGNSSTDPEGQIQASVDVGGIVGSKPNNADAIGDVKDDEQLDNVHNMESNDPKESDAALLATQYSEADPPSQTVLDASRMQIVGDITGTWKVVMHEQSNQYYYWNTVTGETSWEVPNEVAVEVPTSGVNLSLTAEGQVDYHVLLQSNIPATGIHGISNLLPTGMEAYGTVELDKDGKQSSNAFLDYSRTSAENLSSHEVKHATETTECYETTDVNSAQLVKYGQNLLQRLEALKGCLDGYEWIIKEIEFRISDCEALSSYGSSLLPFWWHTKTQLKQLESVISRAEDSRVADKSILRNVGAGYEVVEKISTAANGENHHSFPNTDVTVVVQTETGKQMSESEDTVIKDFSSFSTSKTLGAEKDDVVHSVSNVKPLAEDVDMDVEMEVDDETVAVNTAAPYSSTIECPAPVEPLPQTNPSSVVCPSLPLDEPDIPPPPDEEWIPPPPPESELIPPPPPEDPPAPSYPPPYAEAIPPPFPDQYNMGYALPSYEYYAPAASEVTSLNYYLQADGSHIAGSQQPSYFEPVVSSAYPEVAADVNQVESITYYGISGGAVPHAPVVTVTGSSGFYVESGPVSYSESGPVSYSDKVCVLDHESSVGHTVVSVNSTLPPVKHDSDVSAVAKEPDKGSMQAASNVSAMQLASNALVNGSATAAAPAVTKSKSKVLRSKKRTIAVAPTLRSNKKVSSLVDKWKAAKEELHGEEDEEPEDAVEILEKKRQKEIEEWHARQIASGEAQDNANFLPLGGDWRERVKRRRAEVKTEPGETVSVAVENEKKQPDLVELSKSLPPGWQAYWDESSKEVYYGNSITSETTWTMPTR